MSKRIAIIDDDHVIQESLQETLGDAGYTVFIASDGVSGLELISREKPDLVVADILLPRLHGIALCEKLKASSDFQHIPIILMTGVYKDVNLRMYVHKGLAADFIEKPFREKELLAKIENLLGKAPEKVEAQPPARQATASERSREGRPDRSVDSALDDLVNWAHNKKK
ncbi:MAG: response regulator [Acidobacteriota bacterium]|jgi:DNA-binding response OmpR family regulator|nr:response regulator [Acidobacteriota bacterium]